MMTRDDIIRWLSLPPITIRQEQRQWLCATTLRPDTFPQSICSDHLATHPPGVTTMAKSNALTADELKDLEAIGYVEGSQHIPENISPVLKAKLLDKWAADNDVQNPAVDLPDATYRQNQIVRERAEAAEDGAPVAGRQSEAASGAHPLDHDSNGRKGGVKK